jgi:hypothetical protein
MRTQIMGGTMISTYSTRSDNLMDVAPTLEVGATFFSLSNLISVPSR